MEKRRQRFFKRLKSRVLASLLAGLMVVSYIPLTGYAAEDDEVVIQQNDEIEEEIQETEELTTEDNNDAEEEVVDTQETDVDADEEEKTDVVEEETQETTEPTEETQETETPAEETQETVKPEEGTQETVEPTEEKQETEIPAEEKQETVKTEQEEQDTEELKQAEQKWISQETVQNSRMRIAAARVVSPNLGDIEMNVGETAAHWSYPRLGFFCNYDNTLIAYATMYEYGDCDGEAGDSTIARATAQGYDGSNDEYIKTTIRGLKGGVTTYTIYTAVHMVKSGSATCPQCGTTWGTSANKWVENYSDSWGVTVYDTFELNYNVNGGNGTSGSVSQRVAQEYYTFSDIPTPTKKGYKFLGWSTNANAKTPDADALTVGPSPNATSKTVYAVWQKDETAPEAPKKEDLYGIMKNFVKVHCTNSKANHADKTYATVSNANEVTIGKVAYSETYNAYICNVTVNGAEYAGFYAYEPSFGTGVKHTLAKNETQSKTIVLKWNSETSKWQAATTVPVTFNVTCECKHTDVEYTDNGNGTHDGVCEDCGKTVVDDEKHEYVDGVCTKCGAKEPKKPEKPVQPEKPNKPSKPSKPSKGHGGHSSKVENNNNNNTNTVTIVTNPEKNTQRPVNSGAVVIPKMGENAMANYIAFMMLMGSIAMLAVLVCRKRSK